MLADSTNGKNSYEIPKFYFINLERSKDRLEHMNKFFKKIKKKTGMAPRFQRVDAFDGKKMEANIDNLSNIKLKDMWHKKENNRHAIGPEFGCTYSHIKSMKVFLDDKENTDDVAFICEDDLELFKIGEDFFKNILNQIIVAAKKHELVAVSCVGSPVLIGPMINTIKQPAFVDYHDNRGKLYGTGCYIITRDLAKNITDKYWQNNKLIIPENHTSMVADHFIYPQALKTMFMIPSLFAIKPENDSYIHSEHLSMHDQVQKMMFQMWSNFNIATKTEVAIISNNEWGEDYYLNKTIKYNTPTIGTKFSPEDYVKFIEKFEEYLKVNIVEESNVTYPIGKLSLPESNESILIHFVDEKTWVMAERHWMDRKTLLPKNKSDILFKICDSKFNGTLTDDLLKRFYKSGISKKVVFLSEYCEFKEKYINKKYDAKNIPLKYCDSKNKSCPSGKELFKLCGIN